MDAADKIKNFFLNTRQVMLRGEITEKSSSKIIDQLLYLDNENTNDILLHITSEGGSVHAGLAIYDTIQSLKSEVITYGVGYIYSMAVHILAAGEFGKRHISKNCNVMIHDVNWCYGTLNAEAIKINTLELSDTKALLVKIFASLTHQDIKKVEADFDRDNYMTAKETLKYGIVDKIVCGTFPNNKFYKEEK